MKKLFPCLGVLVCISCQPSQPEQANYHLYHDKDGHAVEKFLMSLSKGGKLRTESASFDLDNETGDELYAYNVILPNFTIYVQKSGYDCLKSREHLFVNIGRWKSGGNLTLRDVDEYVRGTALNQGWTVRSEPQC